MESKVIRGSETYGVAPELLAQLCDRAPDAVCVVDRYAGATDHVFRYVNASFERMYACNRSEILGTSTVQFMLDRSSEQDYERVAESLSHGEPFRVRRGMRRPDGAFLWIEVNFQPVPWDEGTRWMFITRDVTREKEQHERTVQLTMAVERGAQPVSISNASGRKWTFSYVNEAFTRVTGYLPQDVLGKSWDAIAGDGHQAVSLDTIRAALHAGQQVRTELNYRAKNGRLATFEVQIQPIRDNATGEYPSIVTVYQDVTEARQREQKLLYEAEHDLLTGLYNRRFLERALETAITMTRDEPAHALLFADLDGFKEVNDRLGHDAGDEVLRAAAAAFGTAVFQTDTLARWGGDEFAVLLYHCSLENARRTALAMVDAFQSSPDRRGTTVSIGVAPVRSSETLADLVRRADRLCYAAKAAGRDQVFVDAEPPRRVG